jgi:hypothetical protein
MIDPTDFAVLNAIHLKRMATVGEVAAIVSLDSDTVGSVVDQAGERGLVASTPAGAMLMPEGTAAVLDYYERNYTRQRSDPELSNWYERFEQLNTSFIAQISEWQKSAQDPDTLEKAIRSVERLARMIAGLVDDIPRYGRYIDRFNASISKVDAGDMEFVTKPTVDSLHNIWFEFHEDILSVLGRPRDTT